MRGRAKLKGYTPPRPQFTTEERLEALKRIAERAERGEATPADELEAAAHMRALGEVGVTYSACTNAGNDGDSRHAASPPDRDDLVRWTRDAYEGGAHRAEDVLRHSVLPALIGTVSDLEQAREELERAREELERRGEIILRAFRCLDYGEPANRHPYYVNNRGKAKALYAELLEEYRAGGWSS